MNPTTTHRLTSESGNQLIMALSYTQKTSDNSLIVKYVRRHCSTSFLAVTHDTREQRSLYEQFGTYLTQSGLYMESQLSADSYAGELGNQTNLAVKVCLLWDEQLVDSPAYDLDPTSSSSRLWRSRQHLKSSESSEITRRVKSLK